MSPLPKLSEAIIRQHADGSSFERGRSYYNDGAVLRAVRRGDELIADVEGSEPSPYRVRVVFDAGGVVGATCSCPYDRGGWCKHIVAALLLCISDADEVEQHLPISETLARLSAEQMRMLLATLAERDPGLADLIEAEAAGASRGGAADGEAPAARRTPIDTQAVRRQVRGILHGLDRMRRSVAYGHVGDVVSQVGEVLQRARDFLDAGDGRSALAVVDAVTEEYVEGWLDLDGSSGATGEFFSDLAAVWTEAVLAADLTPAERAEWATKLTRWQAHLDDYGLDEAFDTAAYAAEQGWDAPQLQRVLRGEAVTLSDDDAPELDDD